MLDQPEYSSDSLVLLLQISVVLPKYEQVLQESQQPYSNDCNSIDQDDMTHVCEDIVRVVVMCFEQVIVSTFLIVTVFIFNRSPPLWDEIEPRHVKKFC